LSWFWLHSGWNVTFCPGRRSLDTAIVSVMLFTGCLTVVYLKAFSLSVIGLDSPLGCFFR
jgi:hypothetical protein